MDLNFLFFITSAECGWLDWKHVVFGKIIEGMEILKAIESEGKDTGKPKEEIKIIDCCPITF